MREALCTLVRDAFGVSGYVEQTGGGCTVIRWTLEGGAVMVASDESVSAELDCGGAGVAFYAPGAWMDEDQMGPLADAWEYADNITPALLFDLFRTVMGAGSNAMAGK